jgi:hypothetical protein
MAQSKEMLAMRMLLTNNILCDSGKKKHQTLDKLVLTAPK